MPKPKFVCLLIALAGTLAGCAGPVAAPPRTVDQYRHALQERDAYPPQVVLLYNRQRMLDTTLSPAERSDSAKLVMQLGGNDPEIRREVASILSQPGADPALRSAIMEMLLRRDHSAVEQHVGDVMTQIGRDSPLRKPMLDWLAQNPQPHVLAEVVRLWAEERTPTPADEAQYRQVVEKISGKSWDTALLEAVNNPEFAPRGSAVELLGRRVTEQNLRQRLMAIGSQTDAVTTLQTFISKFDCLPVRGTEFAAALAAGAGRSGRLDAAARKTLHWQQAYGYKFNIRDLHLLAGLATDPLRKDVGRGDLVLTIGDAIKPRQHIPYRPDRPTADNFWMHVESLSIADLWNIYLLDEMLSRPRVQMALRVMADRDRADALAAWGGLVFYEGGQAEAKLYPSASTGGASDFVYVSGPRAIQDSRDCLVRFIAHFEKAANASRAGPTPEEIQHAKLYNYSGLILASVSEFGFSAHYFNSSGTVISLGVLPLKK